MVDGQFPRGNFLPRTGTDRSRAKIFRRLSLTGCLGSRSQSSRMTLGTAMSKSTVDIQSCSFALNVSSSPVAAGVEIVIGKCHPHRR